MSKKGGSQTVTQQADPATQQWMQQVRSAATAAGNAPPDVSASRGFYNGAMGAGQNGLAALNGDQGALASYMNPYQQNVIDQAKSQFGDTLATVKNSVADQATQAGAFGGSRYGVALGTAMRGAVQDQDQRLAGLSYQGYNDAMGRAGAAANLGLGAAGAGSQLAMSTDPAAYKLQMMMQGMGPTGGSTTTTGKDGKNFLSGAVGGAGALAPLGPWGALAGGVAGGLSSMF